MNFEKFLSALMLSMALGACTSTTEVAHSPDIKSPIAYAKKVVNDMQVGVQRYSTKLSFSEAPIGNFRSFEADMWPEAGTQAVYNNFNTFCSSIGGEFEQGLCASKSSYHAYFLLEHNNYDTVVTGTRKIRIRVVEASANTSQELYQWAAGRGKIGKFQKSVEQQAAQNLASQRAEQKRQVLEREKIQRQNEYNAEVARRRQLAIQTAELVYQKGTPVCSIDPNSGLCGRYACYTEDSNPNTKRIKVSSLSSQYWVNAAEYFACQ